jgi:ATP-dependent Lon protease
MKTRSEDDNDNNIKKNIKRLETKIRELEDQNEELNYNLEDLYKTINNTTFQKDTISISRNKSKYNDFNLSSDEDDEDDSEYLPYYENNTSTDNTRTTPDNTTSPDNKEYKIISRYLDDQIKKISNPEPYIKRQALSFYNNIKKNQKQLLIDDIKKHMDYYLNLSDTDRSNNLENYNSIIELSDNKIPKLFKILNSSLYKYYKKIALTKLQILEQMDSNNNNEYFKLSQWLDNFLEIPFNILKTPKYLDTTITTKPIQYIQFAKQHLDSIIYGQNNTKNHIIEILAKMISNPNTLGSVFAICGEPGTGKTTLIKEGLSHIFGLPFVFISLGGAQDRAFLAGSNYVYEGSCCGKIIQGLKQAKCMNPIFYFDELDKISNTDKGYEIMNLLIHLTDYSQNSHFIDDYMDGISIDLSKATFIFSFNEISKVSPILLDRMEIIRFKSYLPDDKKYIARNYILPNVIKNIFNNDCISRYNFVLPDKTLDEIINLDSYLHKNNHNHKHNHNNNHNHKFNVSKINKYKIGKLSGGVRYIKQKLEKKLSKINVEILLGKYNISKSQSQSKLNIQKENTNLDTSLDKINIVIE